MKKKLNRIFAVGIGATIIASSLVGCQTNSDVADEQINQSASTDKSDEKIKLRYATGDAGPAVTAQEEIVKAFNESQDKIEVKLETYGTAFDQKLAAAIGAGNTPDIVKMWNFPAYYKSLEPLQDKIDMLEDKDDFYETLFNYADMDGNIYGMPVGFSTRALHYNKTLLDAAGVTPTNEWTMDDLKEASKAVTKDDVTGLYFYYNPDPYAIESMLWSNGGEWINDEGQAVINSDENKEALQYLHDMIYKDKVAFAGNLGDDFGQVMSSEKYAFGEMGKWFISSINDAGVDLGIAPMPSYPNGKSMSVVHAAFLSITTSSKNPEAAWEFIKFYTSYDSVKALSEIEMPIRESVAKDLGYLEDQQIQPFYEMLERSVSERPSLVKTEKWPEVSSEIAAALEAVFVQESANISDILDETQNRVEDIMQ